MSNQENDKIVDAMIDAKEEGISSCCSATVYNGRCAECLEMCDTIKEEEPKIDLGKLLFDFSDLKRKPL